MRCSKRRPKSRVPRHAKSYGEANRDRDRSCRSLTCGMGHWRAKATRASCLHHFSPRINSREIVFPIMPYFFFRHHFRAAIAPNPSNPISPVAGSGVGSGGPMGVRSIGTGGPTGGGGTLIGSYGGGTAGGSAVGVTGGFPDELRSCGAMSEGSTGIRLPGQSCQ